jgi:hypothetical protein
MRRIQAARCAKILRISDILRTNFSTSNMVVNCGTGEVPAPGVIRPGRPGRPAGLTNWPDPRRPGAAHPGLGFGAATGDLAVVIDGDLDAAALTAAVRDSLRQAGLAGPQVTLRRVQALDRDPLTGKARRFIPLGRIP